MAKGYICINIFCYLFIFLCWSCQCSNIKPPEDNNIDSIISPIIDIPIDTIVNIDTIPILDTIPYELPIRQQLINIFQSQVGVKQVTNNSGPEIDMYLAAVGLDPGYAWCGALLGWGFKELKLPIPNGAAWSPSWFPNSKVIKNKDVQVADVGGLYFSSLGRIAHVFVFEEDWDNDKNLITTIEGNTNDTGSRTGDGVYRKYRSKNQISKSSNWID